MAEGAKILIKNVKITGKKKKKLKKNNVGSFMLGCTYLCL